MRREGNKEEAGVTAEKEAIKRGREWKQGSGESLPLLTFIAEFVLPLLAAHRVCVLVLFFYFLQMERLALAPPNCGTDYSRVHLHVQ